MGTLLSRVTWRSRVKGAPVEDDLARGGIAASELEADACPNPLEAPDDAGSRVIAGKASLKGRRAAPDMRYVTSYRDLTSTEAENVVALHPLRLTII